MNWVWTEDGTAPPGQRIRRFPYKKEYLQIIAQEIESPRILFIPKSRQLLLSWINAARLVWGLLYPGYQGFIQTKKETDADKFIGERIQFIWNRLPKWMRFLAMDGQTEGHKTYCNFRAPNGSQVIGVPQGKDQFRGYVPSHIFLDEVAFWEQFEESITSILPLVQGNCGVVCVSTAEPGEFGLTVQSPIRGQKEELLKGLTKWELEYGGEVLEVHYTADPDKDPNRNGAEWYENEVRKYRGGAQGRKWQKEMEIDFNAFSGEIIFDEYDDDLHTVDPFDIPADWPKWRAIDWGMRNETACLWLAYDPEGDTYYIYREFYKPARSIKHTKEVLAHMSTGEFYRGTWIDPASDRHDSQELESVFYRLNLEPHSIKAWKANRAKAGLDLIMQWLEEDRLKVFKSCENTRMEFQQYRYEEWQTNVDKDPKETPRKKFDHAMNALKYFANGVQTREKKRKEIVKPKVPEYGSLGWMLKQRRSSKSKDKIGGEYAVRR